MSRAVRLRVIVLTALLMLAKTSDASTRDPSSGRAIPVPGGWNEIDPEGLGVIDGFAWYLLPVTIPE